MTSSFVTADEAQVFLESCTNQMIAPFIARAEVRCKLPHLPDGMILVDIPGSHDSNSYRHQLAVKERCHCTHILHLPPRAMTTDFVDFMIENFTEDYLKKCVCVRPRTDDDGPIGSAKWNRTCTSQIEDFLSSVSVLPEQLKSNPLIPILVSNIPVFPVSARAFLFQCPKPEMTFIPALLRLFRSSWISNELRVRLRCLLIQDLVRRIERFFSTPLSKPLIDRDIFDRDCDFLQTRLKPVFSNLKKVVKQSSVPQLLKDEFRNDVKRFFEIERNTRHWSTFKATLSRNGRYGSIDYAGHWQWILEKLLERGLDDLHAQLRPQIPIVCHDVQTLIDQMESAKVFQFPRLNLREWEDSLDHIFQAVKTGLAIKVATEFENRTREGLSEVLEDFGPGLFDRMKQGTIAVYCSAMITIEFLVFQMLDLSLQAWTRSRISSKRFSNNFRSKFASLTQSTPIDFKTSPLVQAIQQDLAQLKLEFLENQVEGSSNHNAL